MIFCDDGTLTNLLITRKLNGKSSKLLGKCPVYVYIKHSVVIVSSVWSLEFVLNIHMYLSVTKKKMLYILHYFAFKYGNLPHRYLNGVRYFSPFYIDNALELTPLFTWIYLWILR